MATDRRLEWTLIAETYDGVAANDGFTYRAKVPGGWLVAVWAGEADDHKWGGGLTFVPDPSHGWIVDVRRKLPRRVRGK